MTYEVGRFPRSKLFATLADLQTSVERWEGDTAIAIQQANARKDLPVRIEKLDKRYAALAYVRDLVSKARIAMYECP